MADQQGLKAIRAGTPLSDPIGRRSEAGSIAADDAAGNALAHVVVDRTIDQGFEQLFRDHYKDAYRVAYRFLGSHHFAEEIAQEAYLMLYRHWSHVSDHPNTKALLLRTTINLSLNRSKKEKHRQHLPIWECDQAAQIVSEEFEMRMNVNRTLRRLKSKQRIAIILKHSGFSYKEIGQILGFKLASVSNILSRAENKFRKIYSEEAGRT